MIQAVIFDPEVLLVWGSARAVPGALSLLELLEEKGIPAAAAGPHAAGALAAAGLAEHLRAVSPRPAPEGYSAAAAALGVPLGDCLLAAGGDSVDAALTLGCPVAAVGPGAARPEAAYAFSAVSDLWPLFDGGLMPHLRVSPRPQALPENIITAGAYRITVLTDRLIRVEEGSFTDRATQSVWFRDFPPADFTWTDGAGELRVRTRAVELVLDKAAWEKSVVRFPDGTAAPLDNSGNLLGTCSTLDTNGYHLREAPWVTQYDREHIPLSPGVCSRSGAAVYDDSASLLLSPDGTLTPRDGTPDRYVFAYGHDYQGAVRALYRLCGPTPVIPRWALGNWWCRYWPYTQQEYLDLMDNFADDDIPISVGVIDMDWHHVDVDRDFGITEKGLNDDAHGNADGWTGYTWNKALFPDHRALLAELRRRGMHITLNLHPARGVRWFEDAYPRMAAAMGMDPAEKLAIPFRISDSRFVNNYLSLLHHPLEDEGVDFWWVDWQQGKESELAGLDPLWALNHYHYLDNRHRTGEGLILSRYAGVGSHRYPLGFSGDIHMDWVFLDYMPYFTATASNVGYGWWSHDIGGHHRGLRDEELYLRWLQFGVFSPINRIHCCPWPATSKEPWTLGEAARASAEKWFRFRHKLVPYLYSAAWKNTLEGVPLIRPMYYLWPEEEDAYRADHQYLFGDLLAAPVTEKAREAGIAEKRVWLPEGEWTDIFTDLCYRGGRWVTVYRDCGAMPVFAPAGCILPLAAETRRDCREPDTLEVYVYRGSGEYTLYEGDRPEEIAFRTELTEAGEQLLTVRTYAPRTFHFFFRSVTDGSCRVTVDGAERPAALRHNRCFQVTVTLAAGETARIALSPAPPDRAAQLRARVLKGFIQAAQNNWYKLEQWDLTGDFSTVGEWEAWIASLDLSDLDKNRMRERLNA